MSTNKQSTAHTQPMVDHVELDIAFEDAGGLSPAEYQKPAPSSLTPKTVEASQSLAVVVDTLVDVVGRNESHLLASLNSNDYQQFVGALEALTAVVGENKNHLLTPLMDSIDTLIEKCKNDIEEGNEGKFDMKTQNRSLGQGMPKLHRPEKVERLATRSRVKLSDLLAQETDDTASGEVKTVPPVGSEVW